MTIEQTDVVDFMGSDNQGNVILTISDHLEWDVENEHLLMLQEKINIYLSFIESGEIYDSYNSAKGKSFIINIAFMHAPNESAKGFLAKAKELINEAGFDLTWEVSESNS